MVPKPKLYIHTGRATHFLRWEIPEFKKHFNIVSKPDKDVALLCFGPDVLREASQLPAKKRFAVLFPGFGHNPLYNNDLLTSQTKIISQKYDHIFINKGPLELAYSELDKSKITLYPFSVDTSLFSKFKPRTRLDSLLHVSNNAPQKDWERSERIMKETGLVYEVFPPRDEAKLSRDYVNHNDVIAKYKEYDGFVHVAKDIKDRVHLDGKYTASLIEAGLSGEIIFWHDTFGLGNDLKTVFELPLDEKESAKRIMLIRNTINIKRHSHRTRSEMMKTFNPKKSVAIRARKIKELL